DNNIDPLRTGWWPWLHTTYYNQSGIPGACTKVKGHMHFPNQTHNDPGPNWDWDYYYRLINNNPPAATQLTAASGNFYDSGGASANYSDDERSTWTIAPPNATSVTISFTSFDVENTWDYLFIYDGTDINAPLIGYYTGTSNPGTITSSGGALTFEFRSDCSTNATGWAATWSSTINNTSTDIIPPTTALSINGTWQTTDFPATFSDSDNVGGSGLEKSFYQVIDYDGSDWRANNSRGFFSDNFDQAAIHPDWTVMTGTWGINNGVLEQSDEAQTNSNIYAPLAQNLSNKYLYNWSGKIDGTGNNRRAGFHFFCDDATLPNRNNSYFVWFRVDQSVCEFYKVVNDVFTLENSVPMTVNAGQWYDWKVVYDRITGEMDVYQDNSFVGSWTDPAPYSTGGYVSFRSGNSNWQINNFKVYRSRYSNAQVTVNVGNCPSCDIRYQNTNPSTPAGRVKSVVRDSAGNFSAIAFVDVNIDWTAPDAIDTVNDGPAADIDLSTSPTDLAANWSSSADTNSGLARYYYALGTSPGDSDVVPWTSNWGYDTVALTGLPLVSGQWYYFSVMAENGAGLRTQHFTSDGVLVDLTTGISSSYADGFSATAGPNPFTGNTTIAYNIPQNENVRIVLSDGNGKRIELLNELQNAGSHSVSIDSGNLALASGMYFITFTCGTGVHTIPLIKK
ncbi:MAG TPA: CUB domain-containing protein, partial [Bacteroidia bacterium]|nr:CUB domain-containing protein [Bacteroidia bacterium]